jgi:Glycosyl hydrolases family 15
LEWLDGFASSRPVRVGNAASTQLQLDVYGEVLDALYSARVHGVKVDDDAWSLATALLAWLEQGWRRPDAGIWEVRGPARHFTHSKMMAWLAFERAVRCHDEFGRPGPVARWRELRDEIHAEVLTRSWSVERQAFTQSYDSLELDASVLLMPLVGFLPPDDPRVVATVEAIRRDLTVDGLVMRYRSRDDGAVDGLPAGEGVFLPCSFWLVSVLAMQGRHDEARELFHASSISETTWACCRRNATRWTTASWGTCRRRSRIWHSSTRPSPWMPAVCTLTGCRRQPDTAVASEPVTTTRAQTVNAISIGGSRYSAGLRRWRDEEGRTGTHGGRSDHLVSSSLTKPGEDRSAWFKPECDAISVAGFP